MSLYSVSDNHLVRDVKTRLYNAMLRWFFGPCKEDWNEWKKTAKENTDGDMLSTVNKAEMIGSHLDIQGWIDSAYEEAKEEIWQIQTTFATKDDAIAWMREQVDDDCVDNIRFGHLDDDEEMFQYEATHSNGCCGYFDQEVTVNGRKAKVGCNYGH